MRDVYDQLVAEGETAIEQLVADRQQENVALEFKTKSDASDGEPNRDDRRNLGIVLSAFSNSMGGVLVWGIRAAKDADGVDCATELRPITGIERFKADVTRLVSQAIMPRHDGIVVEAIPSAKSPKSGYLVIYVERSDRRPHRCEIGDRQYFKRSGDSSIAMEHYDIEDSFKRLVVPWLELEWSVRPGQEVGGPGETSRKASVEIRLKNSSSVTARFPFLILTKTEGAYVRAPGALGHGLISSVDQGQAVFAGGADHVIHPDLSLYVTTLRRASIDAAAGRD
jgi:hypothetical protein